MENFQRKDLKLLAGSGQLLGFIMMGYGILAALQNLLPYYVGAIPGLIGIYMGKLIYDTGKEASELIRYKGRNFIPVNEMLKKFSIFLIIVGILLIILFLYYILLMIVSLIY